VALAAFGVFGVAAIGVPAQAVPPDSRNLRGMAGRVFEVRVTVSPPVLAPFTNCHRFGAGVDSCATGFGLPG